MAGLFNGKVILVAVIVIVQTVALVVYEDGFAYAAEGDKVRLLCSQPTRPKHINTRVSGDWTWRASGGGADEKIVSFLSSTRGSAGKARMARRVRVSGEVHWGDYTLDIQHIEKGDEGKFTCSFKVGNENAFKQFNLHVLQATTNASSLLFEGEMVYVSCKTSSGSVSWTVPGGETFKGETLTRRAELRYSGRWTCNVAHPAGVVSAGRTLNVVGFLNPPSGPLYAGLGSTVNLPCRLNQLPKSPGTELGWFQDGERKLVANSTGKWRQEGESLGWTGKGRGKGREIWALEGGDARSGDLSAKLNVGKVQDGGKYQCRLTLGSRTLSRDLWVNIVEVTSDQPNPISEGSEVGITCQVHPAPSPPRVSIRHLNSSLGNLTKSVGTGTITHRFPASQSDTGTWQCVVFEGGAIVATVEHQLQVSGPGILGFAHFDLLLFVALGATILVIILVTVVCVVQKSRRKRQARVRRLRHPLCREHRNQLSHQPLCPPNDYADGNRTLPPCPHRPTRHGPPYNKRSMGKRT